MAGTSAAASPAADNGTDTVDTTAQAGADTVSDTSDANTAGSSAADATDANKQPENLLDVVRSAVEAKPDAEASSTAGDSQGDASAEAGAEGADALASEGEGEDDSKLPFHSHPRFQKLIQERNELREPAANYARITDFMREHGLQPDEVAEGYEVMALLKSNDPVKLGQARDWFATRLSALNETLGAVLPTDLQDRVDNGLIDEATAQELASARAATKLHETRDQQATARSEEERQAAERQETAVKMVSAVEGWETRIKGSDPDYAKKAELVQTTCRAMVQESGKPPMNEADAVALVEAAYAKVNETFKGLLPKPKPIAPTPQGQSAIAAVAPTSLRGAVEAALAR